MPDVPYARCEARRLGTYSGDRYVARGIADDHAPCERLRCGGANMDYEYQIHLILGSGLVNQMDLPRRCP